MKAKNQRAERRSNARPSRRSFLKTGAAFTVALPFLQDVREGGRRLQNVEDAGTLDRQWRQNLAPNHYLLLRGGTVVSMDPKVGDLVKGDVLIQGKKIVSVAAELKAPPQAEVIDARNTIVWMLTAIPGKASFGASFPTAVLPHTRLRRIRVLLVITGRMTCTSGI